VRHAEGLELKGIELGVEQPDARPALVLDDVRRVLIRALQAMPPAEGEQPLLWLRSVRDCAVEGVRPRVGTRRVVRLSGRDTTGVRLAGGDLEPAIIVDADVARARWPSTATRSGRRRAERSRVRRTSVRCRGPQSWISRLRQGPRPDPRGKVTRNSAGEALRQSTDGGVMGGLLGGRGSHGE
jgi:hypothetical protein